MILKRPSAGVEFYRGPWVQTTQRKHKK